MKTSIKIKNLTKKYGKKIVVSNANISISPGEIHGFLGPNGAGKTTTIKLILNLIKPTDGFVEVLGNKINFGDFKYLNNIGYLSGDDLLPENSTAHQLLKLTKNIIKIDESFTDSVIKIFEIEKIMNAQLKTLSRGSKRKIAILLALCTKPKLLVLDEPTEGLDPIMQENFYILLTEMAKNGTTIFFSSHNLAEVQKICSKISFIKNGKIIKTSKINELSELSVKKIDVIFKNVPTDEVLNSIKKLSNNYNLMKINNLTYSFKYNGDYKRLLIYLAKIDISNISIQDVDLESIFLRMYNEVE